MKTGVYTIYDFGAEESSQALFFAKNENVARRLFQNAVSEHLAKIRGVDLSSYGLIYVGEFFTESCVFTGYDTPLSERVIQRGNEVELYPVEDEADPVHAGQFVPAGN